MFVPTSLNIVKIHPLRGSALCVFDPKLVFILVDNFYGGVGRHANIEGRDFSATEQRVVSMVLKDAFRDLEEAWKPVMQVDFEFSSMEVNCPASGDSQDPPPGTPEWSITHFSPPGGRV